MHARPGVQVNSALITRGRRKKLLLVLRLDLPNSVILPLTGPTSAFEKWYGHGTS